MKDIGIVGLGVMGSSLAQNLADRSYTVHAFNRTQSKTDALVARSHGIKGHRSVQEMVGALSRPRKIIIMVPAGRVVDKILGELDGHLDEDDIVVDGGNSDYKDTIRRGGEHRYAFVGCGISGGEEGARHGPSMLVGCRKDAYGVIGSVLEEISCSYGGVSCCGWLGEDGAGHFVKTVHNGIEYCEMQLLQEVFNMVAAGESSADSAVDAARRVLADWNAGELESYVVDICMRILSKKVGGEYALNMIVDDAEQKGTGKMCVVASIEAAVDTVLMAESVMARFLSASKAKRVRFAEHMGGRAGARPVDCSRLKSAFYLCKMVSFVQGFGLLRAKAGEHGWPYQTGHICDIWRNGCILRSSFLEVMKEMSKHETLELSPAFVEAAKEVCRYAVDNGIYAPVFTSCLMWLNGLGMGEMNGSLVQAMRDYFGRHGVVLKSGRSTNIEWD